MHDHIDSSSHAELRRCVARVAILVSLITLGACTTMPTGPSESKVAGQGAIPAGDEAWLFKY